MALTRDYKKTVVARITRDPEFAQALYAEALDALLAGETAEGLSMLRDLVHASISFKELARQTKEPSWNFNKYLVSADGKVVKHFESRVAPDSPEFTAAIEGLLN